MNININHVLQCDITNNFIANNFSKCELFPFDFLANNFYFPYLCSQNNIY